MRIRLQQLVERFGGELKGNPETEIAGIAPLDAASAEHITFLTNPKFRHNAAQTQAAALILSAEDDAVIGAGYAGARIVTKNPYAYFAKAAQYFVAMTEIRQPAGIHETAVIAPSASIPASAMIGPHVVIEDDVFIDEGVEIGAGSFIGRGCRIGANTRIYPRVTLYHGCTVGRRGIIHSGVVIGADGFGFANEAGAWIKIPQVGGVVIGDDVEIGANTTIDRGALSDTRIGNGVKLDNQIQIAHNCQVGDHTAMAACAGVAGSTKIGSHCMIGGAAMISGHLTIADRVHVSAGSLALHSITEPGQYTGFYPITKHSDWEKSAVLVRRLPAMRDKMRAIEKMMKTTPSDKDE